MGYIVSLIRLHKKIDYTRSQHGEQWGGALEIAIYSTLRLRIRCRGRGGRGGDRLWEWRVGWRQVRRWERATISTTVASATTTAITPGLIRVKTDSRVRSARWRGGSNCSQRCNWSWFPSGQRLTFAGTDIGHVWVVFVCCCFGCGVQQLSAKRDGGQLDYGELISMHFLDSHSSRIDDACSVMTLMITFQSSFVRQRKWPLHHTRHSYHYTLVQTLLFLEPTDKKWTPKLSWMMWWKIVVDRGRWTDAGNRRTRWRRIETASGRVLAAPYRTRNGGKLASNSGPDFAKLWPDFS